MVKKFEGNGLDYKYAVTYSKTLDRVVLVFGVLGSNDFPDWISNVRLRRRKIGTHREAIARVGSPIEYRDVPIMVNRIDRAEALEIVRELLSFLEGRVVNTIIGYGSSRGGAIAAQALWELRRRGYIALGAGYGSKRTGNRAFVESLPAQWLHNVNRGDPVPLLPFWPGYARYKYPVKIGKWKLPWAAHRYRAGELAQALYGF